MNILGLISQLIGIKTLRLTDLIYMDCEGEMGFWFVGLKGYNLKSFLDIHLY